MQAYLGHIISALVTIGGVAGFLFKIHNNISARLQRIETRLEIEDKRREERAETYKLAVKEIARDHCRNDCLRPTRSNTNPYGIPIYPGE